MGLLIENATDLDLVAELIKRNGLEYYAEGGGHRRVLPSYETFIPVRDRFLLRLQWDRQTQIMLENMRLAREVMSPEDWDDEDEDDEL